jgi:transcriptional regulator with XRE-family HTH domain/tetratricopeptide (TPR) repeat protein
MEDGAEAPRTGTFGEVLRRYRAAAGLSQEALAERAQLSWRAVSDLERGVTHAPRRETVRLLAKALALSAQGQTDLETAARPLRPTPVVAALRREAWPGAGADEPPLVGRQCEVTLVERHLTGDGVALLLLAGEQGIGKSRVLRESVRLAAGVGWRVLQGGCQRQGSHAPYAPLLAALSGQLRDQPAALRRTELQGCGWLVRLLPELATGPLAPLPAGTLPPEQERRLMCAAVVRYLCNVAGPHGTLLVLDDLQWAGTDALDLLASVLHVATAVPIRVVGAYRDTEVQPEDALSVLLADLASAGLVQQHTLRPLAAGEAGLLLDRHLEGLPVQAEARAQALARAGGVPFFLVSCAQGLRAAGADGSPQGVPWTVTQSVRQRVTALPAQARELLGIAAVAGREVSTALLLAVSRRRERTVLTLLREARRARLVEDVEGRGVRFAHDVIREVVETELGAAQCLVLHRKIAHALERMPGEPPVADLAYHYARSRDDARAALWLERSGDQAAVGFAHAAAGATYTAARERLMACRAAPDALARVDEKLGDLHTLVGNYAQACVDYARAQSEAGTLSLRVDLARKEGDIWVKKGDVAHGLELLTAAATAVTENHDDTIPGHTRALLELSRGEVFYLLGDYAAAEAAMVRAQALLQAEEPGAAIEACLVRAYLLSHCLAANQGDLMQSHAWEARANEHRGHVDDAVALAHATNTRGRLAFWRGEVAEAEACQQQSLSLWEQIGDLEEIGNIWLNLGNLALSRGTSIGQKPVTRSACSCVSAPGCSRASPL